jgi:transcriptional regulator with XRE-family HTH domain
MTFGQYLRDTRRAHQLPLSQLAKCVGLSQQALQDMESNRRLPAYPEIQQLAMALRRPEAELLEHLSGVHLRPPAISE